MDEDARLHQGPSASASLNQDLENMYTLESTAEKPGWLTGLFDMKMEGEKLCKN